MVAQTGSRNVPPLRLMAEDADDVAVIAAVLQDAVVQVRDMAFLPSRRRFVGLFRRFRWECEAGAVPPPWRAARCQRILSALTLDSVLAVRRHNVPQEDPERILSLLTIICEPGPDASATLALIFAEDAIIRLDVECVDAYLRDLGSPWPARRPPLHPLP